MKFYFILWKTVILRFVQFKVDFKLPTFEKPFMAKLLTLKVFGINVKTKKYFFCWRFLTYGLNRGRTSNKPTDFLFDYGDISYNISLKYLEMLGIPY